VGFSIPSANRYVGKRITSAVSGTLGASPFRCGFNSGRAVSAAKTTTVLCFQIREGGTQTRRDRILRSGRGTGNRSRSFPSPLLRRGKVKIVEVISLQSCGAYAASEHWRRTREEIHNAVRACCWPPGSDKFTIFPESGKKRGEGNGVLPIKREFINELRRRNWIIEAKAKNELDARLGDFDALLPGPEEPIAVEWETGNISSSHRSMNKLMMLVSSEILSAGVLAVPSRMLYEYLTDRIGNIRELEPYFPFWKKMPCKSGVLEVVVFEHDATSREVPRIPKGTDGRSLG